MAEVSAVVSAVTSVVVPASSASFFRERSSDLRLRCFSFSSRHAITSLIWLSVATSARSIDWEAAARLGTTLIVLMGASREGLIAEQLLRGGLDADTPVAVVESATTPDQRVVRTVLADLPEMPVHAPAILVIGSVAELDVTNAALNDLVTTAVSEHGGSSWLN